MTMPQIDLTQLDRVQLDEFRIAVTNEQERRQRIADAPQQIADQARRYVEDGGEAQGVIDARRGCRRGRPDRGSGAASGVDPRGLQPTGIT